MQQRPGCLGEAGVALVCLQASLSPHGLLRARPLTPLSFNFLTFELLFLKLYSAEFYEKLVPG